MYETLSTQNEVQTVASENTVWPSKGTFKL